MAKRRKTNSKKSALNLDENSLKAILSLSILLVGFAVLMLFNKYQENILSSSFNFFILLVVVLFALLIGLLFLLNPQRK